MMFRILCRKPWLVVLIAKIRNKKKTISPCLAKRSVTNKN